MAQIAFLLMLTLGVWGWYGLLTWDRARVWAYRCAALICFFGLTAAGMFTPGALRPERNGAHWNATELTGTERKQAWESHLAERVRSATEQIATREGRTERKQTERFQAVVNEIGPPPAPNAVPVLGYTTAAGVKYPSRWRMPPNAELADNLKQ